MVPYISHSQHESFFLFSEIIKKEGANPRNIFILNATNEDYWFRYYILFLTGAEAKMHTERGILQNFDKIKEKYTKIYFVFGVGWKQPFSINIPYTIRNVNGFTVMELDPQYVSKELLEDLVSVRGM